MDRARWVFEERGYLSRHRAPVEAEWATVISQEHLEHLRELSMRVADAFGPPEYL